MDARNKSGRDGMGAGGAAVPHAERPGGSARAADAPPVRAEQEQVLRGEAHAELGAGAPGRDPVDDGDQILLAAIVEIEQGVLAERFHEVPALVIPCIRGQLDPDLDLAWTASLFGSILPAVWSFQLALHSRGLASTFTTAHLLAAGEVAALLNIPDDYLQTCLIPVAYLRGDDLKAPARKDPDEIIAWNTWT